jgi:hypothetical protein
VNASKHSAAIPTAAACLRPVPRPAPVVSCVRQSKTELRKTNALGQNRPHTQTHAPKTQNNSSSQSSGLAIGSLAAYNLFSPGPPGSSSRMSGLVVAFVKKVNTVPENLKSCAEKKKCFFLFCFFENKICHFLKRGPLRRDRTDRWHPWLL